MAYTVGQVSHKLGMSAHTVRYYCDEGLVPDLTRNENGDRVFSEKSLDWLRAVTFLRDSGMPIADIRSYFSLCRAGRATLDERVRILEELERRAQEELEQASFRVECLNRTIAQCQDALMGEGPDAINPLEW